ncbi:hypothetical protein ACIBEJ_04775 [Nonomuraea sp. NPDC050790]|uniref:hypothetical protein n=1 Tax=Nonomuraea sp. NPDC050790 TaxID=3364371 RepID=UPI0037BA44EC
MLVLVAGVPLGGCTATAEPTPSVTAPNAKIIEKEQRIDLDNPDENASTSPLLEELRRALTQNSEAPASTERE